MALLHEPQERHDCADPNIDKQVDSRLHIPDWGGLFGRFAAIARGPAIFPMRISLFVGPRACARAATGVATSPGGLRHRASASPTFSRRAAARGAPPPFPRRAAACGVPPPVFAPEGKVSDRCGGSAWAGNLRLPEVGAKATHLLWSLSALFRMPVFALRAAQRRELALSL